MLTVIVRFKGLIINKLNIMNYIKEAKALAKIGISIVPIGKEGGKKPSILWKEYQDRIMSTEEIERHFADCGGIAAITGTVSNLFCLDFDLDKELTHQDFWKDYMQGVPEPLKRKMRINRTRSGGYHIWLRTTYEDKSRKITHRLLTMEEFYERHTNIVNNGANGEAALKIILRKPLECVIESRSRGSYGVMVHEEYDKFYGDKIGKFTEEEVLYLIEKAYSLDIGYKAPYVYRGTAENYRVLKQFEEDTTPEDVVKLLESTGLYSLNEIDYNGDYKMKREGSSNPYSAKVFNDSGMVQIFGLNILTSDDKTVFTPLDIYCIANDLERDEAIEKLKEENGK